MAQRALGSSVGFNTQWRVPSIIITNQIVKGPEYGYVTHIWFHKLFSCSSGMTIKSAFSSMGCLPDIDIQLSYM